MQPIQSIEIAAVLPNGQQRCTCKKLDVFDYVSLGAATVIAIASPFSEYPDSVLAGSALIIYVFAMKKLCEFTMPFSCRDSICSHYFPERYGIRNYTLHERNNTENLNNNL